MMNFTKLGTYLSIISAIVVILGGGWEVAMAVDSRYLKVEDYRQNEQLKLEDDIFKLELKVEDSNATNVDKAMLERYKRRLGQDTHKNENR